MLESDCLNSFQSYLFRSIGYGERRLPISDISLCDQFALIGGGMIWNIYFAVIASFFGFFAAVLIGLGMASKRKFISRFCRAYVFIFRGSPLFIQFFLAYEILVLIPKFGIDIPLYFTTITVETYWLTRAWLGAAFVLFLNTTAYSAQLFLSAYKSIPKNDIIAAQAYGMHGWFLFKRIKWPSMMRLAWPAYTNELIFLFHATSLVFLSSFPSRQQKGDGLYYAQYLAEKTFNPFISYPIVAFYFIIVTLIIVSFCGFINKRLNKHLITQPPKRPSLLMQIFR